ncbi:peptide chain release factor N(5)-glutamine methyltransferase [Boseongicola aestuarii]|uniref:Release factor glutamine methyltransferase n=1 Tax=Boseongicola aestuarii TaxID=1470561 RepID=A0A238IWF6_9RHOB|nr:peptide chain release factor N(5)-glutamine methyltransferase [Boseongicola aestuarii]SMX22024.1 Release factor glutamine methyltransferase [Boseongicola aestuarii]
MSDLNPRETVQDALYRAARDLEARGVGYAMRDARRLMTHALGIASDRLTLFLREPLPAEAAGVFTAFCERRAAREPVSRIVEGRLFFGRWFKVTPEVLDPRPETEVLIDQALRFQFGSFLDIGTGSGCIAVTLLAERARANAFVTDISERALKIAEENALAHSVSERARFATSDWFSDVVGQFDLIVSNPPYIRPSEMETLEPEVLKGDPHIALTDFVDGLTGYRQIAAHAEKHLVPGGRVLVEIGPDEAQEVVQLFTDAGLTNCTVYQDFDRRDRVVEAFSTKPSKIG